MQQDTIALAPDTLERLLRVSTATLTTQMFKNHRLRTRSVPGSDEAIPIDAAQVRRSVTLTESASSLRSSQ